MSERLRKNRKYSLSDRLFAVKKVLNEHISVRSASKLIGADHMQVKYWVSMYERYGKSGLQSGKINYTGEFKNNVIADLYKNNLTLYDTALKYAMPTPSTVLTWKRLYDAHGSAALYNSNQIWNGAMKTVKPKKDKNNISIDPKTKALQRELEYLKAENAYLKKLQALVQERLARENENEPPLSKN